MYYPGRTSIKFIMAVGFLSLAVYNYMLVPNHTITLKIALLGLIAAAYFIYGIYTWKYRERE
jgi:hypothetical protein